MPSRLPRTLAVAASALLLSSLAQVQAASPQVCEDYAHAAIIQVREMLNRPACRDVGGPRWSSEWRVHYDWCLGASYRDIGAERDARTVHLRRCYGR